MKIFVGSLPYKVEEADLQELFAAYGEVSSVKIITDRETGRSKGFGFIEMEDEAAQKAIDGLNGTEISGRTIAVSQAEERKPSAGGSRGGFGGGNRGGGGGYGGGNRGGGGGYGGGNRSGGGGGYQKDSRGDRWS